MQRNRVQNVVRNRPRELQISHCIAINATMIGYEKEIQIQKNVPYAAQQNGMRTRQTVLCASNADIYGEINPDDLRDVQTANLRSGIAL